VRPSIPIVAAFLLALYACVGAAAQSGPTPNAVATDAATPAPYEPYAFLIGEWDAGLPGNAMFIDRFSWGPNRAYIWQSVSQPQADGEHLHFEGPMVWNAADQRLDFLFAIEPGTLGQERGYVHVVADGVVIREVTLTNPAGVQSTFRHTIRQTGPDTAEASLMRQTAQGWTPNFPGSDHIPMRRRS
jgi:hypothetical protein